MSVAQMLIVLGFSFASSITGNFDLSTMYFYISTAVILCNAVAKHTTDKTTL